MTRLTGKRIFITGAGSGIGRCAAELFAAHGAKIAVGDIDQAGGGETVARVEATGGTAKFYNMDVTEADQVERAVRAAGDAFGGLDVMYNNAGGSSPRDGKVTDLPVEEWWRTIKTDLYGTFLGCRYAIPVIAASGGGAIINMTSVRAMIGSKGADAYSTAKSGIIGLTQALAAECAEDNIRVNAIAPGVIQTERVKKLLEIGKGNDTLAQRHLIGLGEPMDVAQLALYLASDESRLVTGTVIPVDSGVSAT